MEMDYASFDELWNRLTDVLEYVPAYNQGGENAAEAYRIIKQAADKIAALREKV
jgi:hypothetical protein